MSSKGKGRKLTVMLVPDGARESRTFHLSYRTLHGLAAVGVSAALAFTVMAGKGIAKIIAASENTLSATLAPPPAWRPL